MAEVKLDITGRPIPNWPREVDKARLSCPDDPEAGPDCVVILPDGRHVDGHADEWYEVDPVTNETYFDKPVDPEDVPSYLR